MFQISDKFFTGTSGLVLPVPQALYPEEYRGQSRLAYYASLFNSVEINSSFYKLPQPSTVQKWVDMVPAHFRFTFKLFKGITHAKNFEYDVNDIHSFLKTIAAAANKMGCVLIQFPPSFRVEKLQQLKEFIGRFTAANTDPAWKVAIEFRHTSWYNEEVYDLLGQHNICLVIHDLPATATPLSVSTADFAYLRFHGPGGKYRGSYSDEFLNKNAQLIKSLMTAKSEAYVYFNNTMGDALKNLQTLNSYLKI